MRWRTRRITASGWVNMETFQAVQAEDRREWLDVFAFHDVVNRGQTAQTLSDSEPGVQYAFIAASVGHRFGNAAGWSNWTYLTTADLDFDTDGSGGPDAGDAHWNDGAGWLPVGDPETRSGTTPFLTATGMRLPICSSAGRKPTTAGCSGLPERMPAFAIGG